MAAFGLLAVPAAEAQIYTRVRNGVVEATNVPTSREYRLTYPGKGTLIHSRAFRLRPSYKGEFDEHIAQAAASYNVSLDLVRAIIQIESQYDHLAVSSAGAQGIMQLMPDTARRFGVLDSFDPRQNIFGGVQYLRFLLDLFQGDVELAAAGYNAGENAVLKYNGIPPYKETQGYVRKLRSILWGGGGGGAPSWGTGRASTTAAFYTPGAPVLPAKVPAAVKTALPAGAKAAPARPRTYYKWQDDKGTLHVTQAPPADGVTYQTVRALD